MSLDRNKTLGRHAYMFAALTKSRKSGADSKYDGIGAAELQHLTPGVYTIPGLHLRKQRTTGRNSNKYGRLNDSAPHCTSGRIRGMALDPNHCSVHKGNRFE